MLRGFMSKNRLPRDLALEGNRVASISAEQTPAARTLAVDRFREGHIHVLVCTDLMARGIDFPNVQTVVNYDFPQSAVDYVHRFASLMGPGTVMFMLH